MGPKSKYIPSGIKPPLTHFINTKNRSWNFFFKIFFAAPPTTAADLSELNLHCEENELGAIIVKSTLEKKVESEESEESSDQSFDLMCRETLSSPINAK